MGSQNLRQVCAQRLRELGVPVPVPFHAEQWCAALARKRGRPILIQRLAAGYEGFACGVWVATETTDMILVEQAATPQHQEHIIAHELGHMAFDHYGDVETTSELLGTLLPHLNPALVRRVLGRNAYTAREEQEAEVFASMLMIDAPRGTAQKAGAAGSGAGGRDVDEVDRFASALEPGGVWHG
jgi:hypothetical protein